MRTCTIEGCDRKHQAKGLCHPHYNQLRDSGRHQKVLIPCAVCGVEMLKYPTGKKRQPVCGPDCWYIRTYGKPRPVPSKALVPVERGPVVRSTVPPLHLVPASTHPFTDTPCGWCGQRFIIGGPTSCHTARYCTKACAKRATRAARRAREVGATGTFTWAEVMRVFVALGRRCAYCTQPVEGQPDPDHVVPLSRGGRNSITNIVPCCRRCNGDKSDRSVDEWIEWRALRGKPALPIDMNRPELRHLALDSPTRARAAA